MIPESTRPEVAEVIAGLREALIAAQLMYSIEPLDEEPNVYIVWALDDAGYENRGIVGWAPATEKVCFFAFDPMRAAHDEQEGISEDESTCMWDATTAPIFLLFLKGRVREIMAKERVRLLADLDSESPPPVSPL